MYIIVGATDLKEETITTITPIKASKIIKHPKYNFVKLENDIALIKLSSELQFSDKVQPVKFASDIAWEDKEIHEIYEYCVGVGWHDAFINVVYFPILINFECNSLVTGVNLNNSKFCTSSIDTEYDFCQEESGGPLLCGEEQVSFV